MEEDEGVPMEYLPQDDAGGNYQLDPCRETSVDDLYNFLWPVHDDDLMGTKQLAANSSVGLNHVQADADPSAGMYHAGDSSPVGVDQPSPLASANGTIQVGLDIQPDNEMVPVAAQCGEDDAPPVWSDEQQKEIEERVRVAAQCGEDNAPTVWSDEEQKVLLNGLAMYANVDPVKRCFNIAFHLLKKTTLDVALRCRWLQDKGKTADRAELPQKDSASGNLKKVTGNKVAKINNKIYPLSKEALNSKSNKELIQDNNMFLKRIEENLRTGQLENTADYFYYVKTNMDVIEERGSKFGISMDMPPIDEQGLDEIIRSRLNSLALREDS